MINLGGRPKKFETPEELKIVIEEYFNTTPKEEWTVTGLSLNVGSKQLLKDYEERDGYGYLVKEAKLIVENGYEIDLKKYGRTGTIFALKNFDWKDKSEQEQTILTPKPILVTDVQSYHSNQAGNENVQENQSDMRGDISQQDNIDTLIPDTPGTI